MGYIVILYVKEPRATCSMRAAWSCARRAHNNKMRQIKVKGPHSRAKRGLKSRIPQHCHTH